jgi:hypothetical protein
MQNFYISLQYKMAFHLSSRENCGMWACSTKYLIFAQVSKGLLQIEGEPITVAGGSILLNTAILTCSQEGLAENFFAVLRFSMVFLAERVAYGSVLV